MHKNHATQIRIVSLVNPRQSFHLTPVADPRVGLPSLQAGEWPQEWGQAPCAPPPRRYKDAVCSVKGGGQDLTFSHPQLWQVSE